MPRSNLTIHNESALLAYRSADGQSAPGLKFDIRAFRVESLPKTSARERDMRRAFWTAILRAGLFAADLSARNLEITLKAEFGDRGESFAAPPVNLKGSPIHSSRRLKVRPKNL
jgi:hypothetical protein